MAGETRDLSFGQIAVREGLCTQAALDEALEIQQRLKALGVAPKKLGEILVEKGALKKEQVEQVLKQQRGLEERRQIAGYEIVSLLGKGGMGAVYKARQLSLDRVVALKILPPRYNKDKAFIKKFFEEARTIAKLNHENIVAGIDVGESNGYYYFTMEFVDGETVASIIEREGALPEKRALKIAEQIARALAHAQKSGLVHRDVKPQNIMLTKNDVAKLCDLGLAKSEDGGGQAAGGSTGDGAKGLSIGTPHYISPEQARGESDVDIRSDIYSLGATLYHMVTGETPFVGNSPMVLMTKHLTEDPAPARKRNPRVSRGVSDLIAKMMQKARDDRHQSPIEVGEDIERLLLGRPLAYSFKSDKRRAAVGAGSASGLRKVSHGGGSRLPARYGARAEREGEGGRRGRPRERPLAARARPGPSPALILAGILLVLGSIVAFALYRARQTQQPPPERHFPDEIKESRHASEAEEEAASAALQEVWDWRRDNPDDPKGLIERLRKVAEDHPNTAASVSAKREVDRLRRGG